MIRLQDVVQVLDRPVAATAPQDAFLVHSCNRRPGEACRVGGDDAGLRMRRNRRVAAAASRKPERTKSIVAPGESRAQEREPHRPLTRT